MKIIFLTLLFIIAAQTEIGFSMITTDFWTTEDVFPKEELEILYGANCIVVILNEPCEEGR